MVCTYLSARYNGRLSQVKFVPTFLPGVMAVSHRYNLYLSQVWFVPTFLPGVVTVPHRYGFHAEGLGDFVRLVRVDSRQVDVLRGVRPKLRVLRSAA